MELDDEVDAIVVVTEGNAVRVTRNMNMTEKQSGLIRRSTLRISKKRDMYVMLVSSSFAMLAFMMDLNIGRLIRVIREKNATTQKAVAIRRNIKVPFAKAAKASLPGSDVAAELVICTTETATATIP